jgi:hypothetical protein
MELPEVCLGAGSVIFGPLDSVAEGFIAACNEPNELVAR